MILKNFIVFEGIDGSGTTTQLRLLEQACYNKQDLFHFTQEPTNGPIGQIIRKGLSEKIGFNEKTIAYLFAADRCEHVYGTHGIYEQLTAGKAVFSDRYIFSSLAYQGLTVGDAVAGNINRQFPLPEYLFFFDIAVDIALKRIQKRQIPQEMYEKAVFQYKVAKKYKEILSHYAQTEPAMHIVCLDASRKEEEIHKIIWSVVKDLPKFIEA